MFDRNDISAYKSISAPPSLKMRVLASAEGASRPTSFFALPAVRRTAALAACVALVAVSVLLFSLSGGGISVTTDGQAIGSEALVVSAPASDSVLMTARMQPVISLPLELELDGDAQISVSHGVICLYDAQSGEVISRGTQLTAQDDISISWEIEYIDTETQFEMLISDGRDTVSVILALNEATNQWSVCLSE